MVEIKLDVFTDELHHSSRFDRSELCPLGTVFANWMPKEM